MKEVPLGEEVEEQTSCGWEFGFGAARNGRGLAEESRTCRRDRGGKITSMTLTSLPERLAVPSLDVHVIVPSTGNVLVTICLGTFY
jgi:hypothetical protein